MIQSFVAAAKLEDRKAVVRQLLTIRYETLDELLQSIVESLAQLPSNAILRLILCRTYSELLASLESQTEIEAPDTDLFQVIGPIEKYYLKKEAEQKAMETLAELKYGEIDHGVDCAIAILLQSPIELSMKRLYSLSREELIAEFS
jgi:hypothetical protein